MKIITLNALTLAMVASCCLFTSCEKDEEKEEFILKSRTDLLTTKNWRVSAVSFVAGTTTTDVYALLPACEKDDFVKFNTNKSLLFDKGPLRCDPSSPQTTTGSWDLTVNDTKLTTRESPTASGKLFDVVDISESTLTLSRPTTFRGVAGTETRISTAF
ncbi:hypothetical protein IC235_04750 [Hymenobacter sp. BT664]|uniref:Lipocalin-like domain-containing protein n=1 Tax=Hymenobacter montanus TaxID=2771359 RepID=A0A927GI86_9BACT|nr:hypothetical protein [Hymenobacter montanus]MBD2767198.1 hypothetical protein [Hymenobacter montanus]